MRRLALVISVAVLAAACSTADADDAASLPTDGGDEAAALPASDFDYSTIDYDLEPAGSALRGNRNLEAFPPPLVDPSDITSGGPPPDGIPPIDDPRYITIAEARDDLIEDDDEGVVVVEINGDARAFPISILIWHEIVNDTIGGVPVSVTYCPLCNSALVFERTIGDRILDFGTSGELYQSALVMYDRQTESLWAHFTGQGLVGHYAGAELELVPAQTLGFASFVEAFPDGQVLSADTGFRRDYGRNPYVGYDQEGTNPISGFISQPIDDQFEEKARLIGVIDDDGPFSILLEDLAAAGVVAVTDGGRNLVALHTSGLASSIEDDRVAGGRDVGQTGVYRAVAADGTPLTFRPSGDTFVDDQTGSTWDILGRAIDGELAGERLDAVPHIDTFWFSWSTYQPDQVAISP